MTAPADPVHSNIDARFPQAMERAARVRLMVFDVDGVLTDGRLLVGPEGEISKAFDTLDGHGIKLLAQAGITPAIITGRQSEIVAWRAGELGIEHLYQGVADKREAFAHLLAATELQAADAGYMGDDWPTAGDDTGRFCGLPRQAHAELRSRAHYVAQATGGRGAVREVADLILKAQGAYDALLAQLLQAPQSF
ncbi:3-deoxy-D-manno-octulosonate 8-phosphate phosphatase [Ralstonia mannitolilytica]|nr:3-deoxy-D-manno-octulosonate 8-phosphate phosphatase [Ralstonia mannitolilytica]